MSAITQRLERYPFLLSGRFVAAVLGHFAVDFMNSQRPLLLAAFALLYGLTNTQVGFFAMSATLMAALSQPLFGYVADRVGGRAIATAALLWMGLLYMGVGLWSDPRALWLMVLASLGSGAFHPQGVMNATQAGGDKRTLATSIFFTAGQLALGFGPAIGGLLLAFFGVAAVSVLGLLALPIGLLLWMYTPATPTVAEQHVQARMAEEARDFGVGRQRWVLVAAFALLLFLRSWANHSNIAFLPKLLQDRGWSQEMQGLALTVYMLSSAISVIVFGRLADEFGRQRMLKVGLTLAIVPLYFYPTVHGPLLVLLVGLTGALIGGVHSILIVMAQSLLPQRMAFASGLALGYMFASGAVGQMITGFLADLYGLDAVLRSLSGPLALAALLSWWMPRRASKA